MKVAKFGGSSVASVEQLEKVYQIIAADSARRFIIVSAPGKRYSHDIKITDLLINYAECCLTKQSVTEVQQAILNRYLDICKPAGLENTFGQIKQAVLNLVDLPTDNEQLVYDTFKASGEDNNAHLVAAYLTSKGIPSEYLSPKEAGIVLEHSPHGAMINMGGKELSPDILAKQVTYVIPGFFGFSEDGQLCTFSRGGSDISGSLVAANIKADLYENFTDVDAIYCANPNLIPDCPTLKELTFKEMRELSYSGFGVLHDEALIPTFYANIPVVIKNTNNPSSPGTMILPDSHATEKRVVGIAADSGFTNIYLSKYLMNREFGFGHSVLNILTEFDLQYDHMPSGIDDISLIMRQDQLTPDIEKRLIERFKTVLHVDEIKVTHHLSMIALVGEGMKQNIGVASRATHALSINQVNIEMLNQGSSEVSIFFGVNEADEDRAVKALYEEFFVM
ncbi:aspartate kinase [Vagococcus vulneris]|uniref:Aspartokinase n=1 Tax=Vagococcus vulneris TaxID=1977869 RepID=A0A429ZY12_9ENTE|nr:aspartate kinase [Vagococcus vulneris]RST98798.1 aspartate kinase [Vagococcus vulneris]